MRIGGYDPDDQVVGEKCEAGVHPAVLAAVYDLGLQNVTFDGKPKVQRKACLWWEIDVRDTKGRRFSIPQVLTASSSEKANMTKVYGALTGHAPTEQEMADGFDMDPLIGTTCLVQVEPPREGKKWPYISNVMPLPKSMPRLRVEGDLSEEPKFVTMMKEKALPPTATAVAAKAAKPAPNYGIADVRAKPPPASTPASRMTPEEQAEFDKSLPF